MKRKAWLFSALFFPLAMTACGTQEEAADDSDTTYDWGITMTAENVTPTGADIVIRQEGGKVTGELNTGSFYVIERLENGAWTQVPYLPQEGEVAWTSVAFMLEKGSARTFSENWGWLYGELPEGAYRIGKGISDFRGTGDYDDCMYYAEFTIGETES